MRQRLGPGVARGFWGERVLASGRLHGGVTRFHGAGLALVDNGAMFTALFSGVT